MNSTEAADALGATFENSIISTVNFRNEISIEIKLEPIESKMKLTY